MNATTRLAALALASFLGAGCDATGIAYGDENSIIAVMSPEMWDEISEDVYAALEPTIVTVRDEKTFTVTYQDPMGERWPDMRRFRQMLLVGTVEDARVVEALERSPLEVTHPGIHRLDDIWARGQTVTLVLLGVDDGPDEIRQVLPLVNQQLDEAYRSWVVRRMYMTGVDSALADTLFIEAGFQLLVPVVYRWERQDSVYIFRNDNPDPSELIRQIAVTWRSPVPPDMQPEGILAWRDSLVASHYSEPQLTVVEGGFAEPFEYRGRFAYQIQAMWRNPPERNWPAGGPLITRAIICENQNRMYLVDSWLYAPGKEKYEYMIQLETILDSFRCGAT